MDPATRQIADAYIEMATEAKYRPQAPSDGFGTITMPVDELILSDEAEEYAKRWVEDEDSGSFYIGCTDFQLAKATFWAVEAARLLCSGAGSEQHAAKLLRMAAENLEAQIDP